MRVLVTGNAGAGKSTIAKQIASSLGVPLVGLDSVVWGPGWTEVPKDERETQEKRIAERANWVVDGVSFAIQEEADLVVFLDCPRWLSYWRCARRNLAYLFRSRPGLPKNCPEILIVPTLAQIIWQFPTKVRPKLLKIGRSHRAQRFEQVRSAADLQRLMQEFDVDP